MRPGIAVCDEQGRPATNVTWLCAETPTSTIITLCNLGRETVRVTLRPGDQPVGGQELLRGEATAQVIPAASLEPMLIRMAR